MLAIAIGGVIGLVLGLTGAGGSVFAVPLLVLLLGLNIQDAAGLSLGAVFVSALVGVLLRIRSQDIQWLPAGVFAVFGALSAPIGGSAAQLVSETWIVISFSILVAIIARRMWRQAGKDPEQTSTVRAMRGADTSPSASTAICGEEALSIKNFRLACLVRLSSAALLTGLLSGFYGVGGGFLIVPVLMHLLSMSIRQAVGTSLLVIMVISGSGFVGYWLHADIELALFQWLALGGLVGMVAGLMLSKRIAGPVLQRFFAVMMVVLAGTLLISRGG